MHIHTSAALLPVVAVRGVDALRARWHGTAVANELTGFCLFVCECECVCVVVARNGRFSKSARMDDSEAHVENYGPQFGTHQSGIASKTGNNVFFAGAKIPTRRECDDSSTKNVSLHDIYKNEVVTE